MKKKTLLFCLFISCLFIVSFADAKMSEIIVEQKKAVVIIHIYDGEQQIESGPGFIIDEKGLLVTNYHLLAAGLSLSEAKIVLKMENGDFVQADKITAYDKDRDLVLIQLQGTRFPSLKLSTSKPKQGDDIVVIGSLFGLETTMSEGIISSIRGKDDFLQITAPIFPGISGSPVFNSSGEVIGVATLLIEGGQNLNFAIPLKYISNLQDRRESAPELSPVNASVPTPESPAPAPESETLSYEGQTDNSIEDLSLAIALTPDDASLYYKRANLFRRAGKNEEAINDYSNAIAREPNNGLYFYRRHYPYISTGQYDLALLDVNMAIELKKYTPAMNIIRELFSSRGWVYINLQQLDKAFEDYKKALEIDSHAFIQYPPYWKVSKEAIDDYIKFSTKLISLKPEDAELYSYRSDLYKILMQYDKAISDVSKAIELDPAEILYYYSRAGLYVNKGVPQKAKNDFQKTCNTGGADESLKAIVDNACEQLAEIEKRDEKRGEQWVRFSSSESEAFFYDKNYLSEPSNKNIRVWIRIEGEKPSFIQDEKEAYWYSMNLWEYDCNKFEVAAISYTAYSISGKVLHYYMPAKAIMEPLVPDSSGDILRKIVCDKEK